MPIASFGHRPERLVRLMRETIRRCALDLSGIEVLTEAASGAYVVTPVLAGMAGARRVHAVARDSRHGSVDHVERVTLELARAAGVTERIVLLGGTVHDAAARSDVITNSGHVRPIDAAMLDRVKPSAVVPLMYEAWEFRPADLDLEACARRGIPVAGTNESHPVIDLLPFVGLMALRLLFDGGVAVYGSRILVWSDNPFRTIVTSALARAGAAVQVVADLEEAREPGPVDAILVAMRPRRDPIVGEEEAEAIARRHPGAMVFQFWGDLDRAALSRQGLAFWPEDAPPPGHQGILPSGIGPEPVVRLQAGGLKVGEVMARARMSPRAADAEEAVAAAVASGFGQALVRADGLRPTSLSGGERERMEGR
jgi:hypothetical protein